jgi:hypothetical protein
MHLDIKNALVFGVTAYSNQMKRMVGKITVRIAKNVGRLHQVEFFDVVTDIDDLAVGTGTKNFGFYKRHVIIPESEVAGEGNEWHLLVK